MFFGWLLTNKKENRTSHEIILLIKYDKLFIYFLLSKKIFLNELLISIVN